MHDKRSDRRVRRSAGIHCVERLEDRRLLAAAGAVALPVADVNTSGADSTFGRTAQLGDGALLFTFNNGRELWRTDGTAAGTSLVTTFSSPSFGGNFQSVATVGDRVFYQASAAQRGPELWMTDGTPAGTVLVKDIFPGP